MRAKSIRNLNVALVLAICATAFSIFVKLYLTRGELLPGLDGAYYWVQVRSILENGSLAFDDLPIVFWTQAAIAYLIDDIPLAVRISDAFLPALAAIPIYLMTKRAKNMYFPSIAILVVLLAPVQLYYFTGDFIKNEAAIPLVFFLGLVLSKWETRSRYSTFAWIGLLLILTGLTHFGTFLLAISVVGVWGLFQLRAKSYKFWVVAGLSTGLFAVLSLAALAMLVPSRYERLISLVSSPADIFSNPTWQVALQGKFDSAIVFNVAIAQIGAIGLAVIAWRNRDRLSYSAVSLIGSALLTSFFFSSPLLGMEWSDRLSALTFAPLSIAGFMLFGLLGKDKSKYFIWGLAVATLLTSLSLVNAGAKKSVITDYEYSNMGLMSQAVDIPENSIVVAEHGIEFLVAWTMHTNVVQVADYKSNELGDYSHVYSLQRNRSSLPPSIDGGNMPPPPSDGTPPPGGDNSQMAPDAPNVDPISGETVYENDSFTLIQVR